MENKNGNIVMFPKWKTNLERSGLQAFKEKNYQEAIEALQPLLEYDVANHDVITGLLMSWIELGKFDEAEELCKEQMKVEFDHYYHYLHIYITILFHDNRYQDLIELLDEVFESEDVPHQSRTQLWQMYEVSRKLLEDGRKEDGEKNVNVFLKALENADLHKQWQALNQLRKQPAQAYLDTFMSILLQQAVHPIIKTVIIEWFRDSNVRQKVKLHKFGQQIEIVPAELNQLQSDYIIKQIQMRLGAIEQDNPTMYEMLDKLLYHYFFIRYPIYPNEQEVPLIVEALKQIGHDYLQIPYEPEQASEGIDKYKEEIELCEQHYLLLVGE